MDSNQFEITRPHSTGKLYEFLIDYKMKTMCQLVGKSFNKLKLLNVCCGSGMEAEYFSKLGAQITALDISSEALMRAIKRSKLFDFEIRTTCSDAEFLPFKSGSFDYVFVHDGLHHLVGPEKGIREMARVAKKGIFFTEPADAFITRVAVKLGLADEYEEVGNFVYRFSPRKLRFLFSRLGLNNMRFKRYSMWYPHYPPWWFRLFGSTFMLGLFKIFFYLGNAVFGRFGNKLTVVAWKNDNQNTIRCI